MNSQTNPSQQNNTLRIAVLAHALRGGGGLSVGQDLILEMVRQSRNILFFFTFPFGKGYEQLELENEGHSVVYYKPRGGYFGRLMWDSITLPALLRRFRPDALLALGNKGLLRPPCPQAILCHDAHLFYPKKYYSNETYARKCVKAYQRWHLNRALKKTDLLLCQTEVARKHLLDTYQFKDRTALCENAINEAALGNATTEDIPDALKPFPDKTKLFCLSTYYPHKNLEILVEVFDKYRKELSEFILVLTIAPDQHPRAKKMLSKIADLDLTNQIINVGPLPQEMIGSYYRNCHGLILPTVLESFTRTYIEAMHFETPILTSDLAFAHDICGVAAIYFNPWEPESIKNAIISLNSDRARVEELIRHARQRLKEKQKTWTEIADNTLQLITAMAKRI